MATTMSVGSSPNIRIEQVSGDLSVVGWEGEQLLVKPDEASVRVDEAGTIVISCEDDLALRVPTGAALHVVAARGDVSLRNLAGRLDVRDVQGDLSIRDVASAEVGRVHSSFSLRSARGDVHVVAVDGDASARDVQGRLHFDSIAADLVLREIAGGLTANVGADAVVYLKPQAGREYVVSAGDDVLLVLPPEANATLMLSGDEISVDWEGVTAEDSTRREIKLGTGAASIRLNAGGEIRVTDRADAGAFADEHGNLAGVNFDWSGLGQQIARRAEGLVRRIEKKTASAVRRAERTAAGRAAAWKVGRSGGAPFASAAAPGGATDEERLAILKMLELKKITAEQAESLLAALE